MGVRLRWELKSCEPRRWVKLRLFAAAEEGAICWIRLVSPTVGASVEFHMSYSLLWINCYRGFKTRLAKSTSMCQETWNCGSFLCVDIEYSLAKTLLSSPLSAKKTPRYASISVSLVEYICNCSTYFKNNGNVNYFENFEFHNLYCHFFESSDLRFVLTISSFKYASTQNNYNYKNGI